MAASHKRRSNGEGSVYEASDGRFRAALIVTHPTTGKQVRRYVSGRTRAETVRRLDALKREAAAGFTTGLTTGEYLAGWVEAVRPRLRPATHREYARHVRDYLVPLARVPLTRLTPADVERVMAGMLERGLSPLTARHARSTLRRALHDAQRDGTLTRNVAALARPPRLEHREMRALSGPEVRTLLAATADEPFGPLYAVAVGSGLRLGELLGLRWSDVSPDEASLVVRRSMARAADGGWCLSEPKTPRSRRTVMLPAIAADGLRRQRDRQAAQREAVGSAWQDREGLIFTDDVGRPLLGYTVSGAFKRAVTRMGMPEIRLHDMRHTAASLMLGAGVPLKVVSESLGHSSIAVTADVYAHITPELRREAADAMDRALS